VIYQGWMGGLRGTPDNLREFHTLFSEGNAGDVKVIKDGESFFLAGDCFSACTSPGNAISIACSKLELMAGVFRLIVGDADISIYKAVHIDINGVKSNHISVAGGVRVGCGIRVFSSSRLLSPHVYVKTADGAIGLDMALRLWSEPSRTWPRLYRIAEEIQKAFSKDGKKTDMSKVFRDNNLCNCSEGSDCRCEDQTRIFKHCANEPSIAGADARHGAGSSMPMQELPDSLRRCGGHMTHNEAVRFVETALVRALQRKSEDSSST